MTSAFLQRRAIHQFVKRGLYPSVALSSNQLPSSTNKVNANRLMGYATHGLFDSLQPHLQSIDSNICKLLKLDLATLDKVMGFFNGFGNKHLYASVMLVLARTQGAITKQHALFSEVVELTSFGASLHRTLVNEDVNRMFGDKVMILGGDYMISNASIQCCRLNSITMIQLLCLMVQDMAKGEVLQKFTGSLTQKLDYYYNMSLKGFGNMLGLGCKGIAHLTNTNQDMSFAFGKSLGMALKVMADIREFNSGVVTERSLPVIFADSEEVSRLITQKDFEQAKEIVDERLGVEYAREVAIQHLQEALTLTQQFGNKAQLTSLVGHMANYLY